MAGDRRSRTWAGSFAAGRRIGKPPPRSKAPRPDPPGTAPAPALRRQPAIPGRGCRRSALPRAGTAWCAPDAPRPGGARSSPDTAPADGPACRIAARSRRVLDRVPAVRPPRAASCLHRDRPWACVPGFGGTASGSQNLPGGCGRPPSGAAAGAGKSASVGDRGPRPRSAARRRGSARGPAWRPASRRRPWPSHEPATGKTCTGSPLEAASEAMLTESAVTSTASAWPSIARIGVRAPPGEQEVPPGVERVPSRADERRDRCAARSVTRGVQPSAARADSTRDEAVGILGPPARHAPRPADQHREARGRQGGEARRHAAAAAAMRAGVTRPSAPRLASAFGAPARHARARRPDRRRRSGICGSSSCTARHAEAPAQQRDQRRRAPPRPDQQIRGRASSSGPPSRSSASPGAARASAHQARAGGQARAPVRARGRSRMRAGRRRASASARPSACAALPARPSVTPQS